MRFIVAIVDSMSARAIDAARADVVADAAVVGEPDVDRLPIGTLDRFRSEFANKLRPRIYRRTPGNLNK